MAVTVVIQERDKTATRFRVTAVVQFDASYLLGGEPLTAADFGLSRITAVCSTSSAANAAGTLIAPVSSRVAAGIWYLAVGFDNAINAAAGLAAVASTTDISTLFVTVEVIGY